MFRLLQTVLFKTNSVFDAIDKNLLLQEPLVVMLTLGKIKDVTGVSGVG